MTVSDYSVFYAIKHHFRRLTNLLLMNMLFYVQVHMLLTVFLFKGFIGINNMYVFFANFVHIFDYHADNWPIHPSSPLKCFIS